MQGPVPGCDAYRRVPIERWTPESVSSSTVAPPPPGTRVASVVVEQRALAAATMGIALVSGVAAFFQSPVPAWSVIAASVLPAWAGIGIGQVVAPTVPDRYRFPQPWPEGVIIETPQRTVLRTVSYILIAALAVGAIPVANDDPASDYLVIWAGVYAALGAGWWYRVHRLAATERALGVTLYRDLWSRKRRQTSRRTFARR